MKNTILFDIDGTIFDSTRAIVNSFKTAFDYYENKNFDEEKLKKLIGYPLDIIFDNLGIKNSEISNYIEIYSKKYREISKSQTKFIQNAKEAIKFAYDFANLGVVTTKNSNSTKDLLKHFEILDYFKVVIGKNDVKNPKPDAEPILKALSNLKFENAFMVGDTKLDLIAAKNAKITPVGVTCGYGDEKELKIYTNLIFCDIYEAVKFIKENFYF